MTEVKNKVDFENAILKIAENITENATTKQEKNSRVVLALTTENKTIIESSLKVNNYSIDKTKNILSVVVEPELRNSFIGKIYGKTSEEIEQIAFKHRKNISVNMAIAKISKLHLGDHETFIGFLKAQ